MAKLTVRTARSDLLEVDPLDRGPAELAGVLRAEAGGLCAPSGG